jgi:hypothetical protein
MYKRKVKCRGFWWNSLTGSDHLEALGIDGMTVLKLILTGSKWGQMMGSCEYGN